MLLEDLAKVSIHAPVKGATQWTGFHLQRKKSFNPRTREGCDQMTKDAQNAALSFNPRTREGYDCL